MGMMEGSVMPMSPPILGHWKVTAKGQCGIVDFDVLISLVRVKGAVQLIDSTNAYESIGSALTSDGAVEQIKAAAIRAPYGAILTAALIFVPTL